nr:MAG TPA: hypothetical protein [Caudoviricetes sp.]
MVSAEKPRMQGESTPYYHQKQVDAPIAPNPPRLD